MLFFYENFLEKCVENRKEKPMFLVDQIDKKMINTFEKLYFDDVKTLVKKSFPDKSFLFLLEGWNTQQIDNFYVQDTENIDLDHYEAWISIYPLSDNCFQSVNDETLVACCNLLGTSICATSNVFLLHEDCGEKLCNQLKELFEEQEVLPDQQFHQEDERCVHAKMLSF